MQRVCISTLHPLNIAMKSIVLISSMAVTVASLAGLVKIDTSALTSRPTQPVSEPAGPPAPSTAAAPIKPAAPTPAPAPVVVSAPAKASEPAPRVSSRSSFAPAVSRVAPAVVSIRVMPETVPVADREPEEERGGGSISPEELETRRSSPSKKPRSSDKDWDDEEVRGGSREYRRQSDDELAADGATGQGSGVVFRADGYILTNHHVIEKAGRIEVTLTDSRQTFQGEVVGSDPQTDIAVIRVKADKLPAAPLGDSALLQAGDWVLAMGSPFGLSRTVTAGIVSTIGRSELNVTDFGSFIQTDAPINPGNSGGPLVDADRGTVIGISTAIFSRTGGNVGIGFAIPIRQALSLAEQIIENGHVRRGGLGVVMETVDADMARALSLPSAEGALVQEVKPGSPAEKAGLHAGDVILSIDGQAVRTHREVRSTVASNAPGRVVSLTIFRDGKKSELKATLGDLSAYDPSIKNGTAAKPTAPEDAAKPLVQGSTLRVQGMTLELSSEAAPAWLSGKTGLVVTAVEAGSLAARKGVKEGAWLIAIAGQPLRSVEEARRLFETHASDIPVLLTLQSESAGRTLVAMPVASVK